MTLKTSNLVRLHQSNRNRRQAIAEQCLNFQETGYLRVHDKNTKLPKYSKGAPSVPAYRNALFNNSRPTYKFVL